MTEQMKQALKQEAEYCKGDYTENNYSVDVGDVPFLFIEGVTWYINNLWHDANKEQPQLGSSVLISKNKKNFEVMHSVLKVYEDRFWCYIEDLFPTIEKEQ